MSELEDLKDTGKAVADSLGYTLRDHHLALYGYCRDCVAKCTKD